MFEQSKLILGLVKLTPYHEVHIYTQGEIFVEDDISAYEYSNICVRKCSALSQQSLEVLPLEGALPMVVAPVEFLEEQLGEELPLERGPSTPTALWEEFWCSNPSLHVNTGFKCQILQSSLAAAWDLWLLWF